MVGDTDLRFSNDFELLRSEVARQFPTRAAAFDGMARELEALPFDVPAGQESARAYLTRHLGEARLVDLLLLPILFYGSPTPSDVDFPSFVVLWKSLYEEGFARPRGGIRPLLDALRSRYLELGGELRMKAGVAEILPQDPLGRLARADQVDVCEPGLLRVRDRDHQPAAVGGHREVAEHRSVSLVLVDEVEPFDQLAGSGVDVDGAVLRDQDVEGLAIG